MERTALSRWEKENSNMEMGMSKRNGTLSLFASI
jgi:hypothetical protein